jgi:hypothetical protein
MDIRLPDLRNRVKKVKMGKNGYPTMRFGIPGTHRILQPSPGSTSGYVVRTANTRSIALDDPGRGQQP